MLRLLRSEIPPMTRLAAPLVHPLQKRRHVPPGGQRESGWLTVHKASLHNLQHITVDVPLKRLVAVTGVSGSGKSTLARDVLLTNLQFINTRGAKPSWQGCERVDGWQQIDRVLEVDQTPIGKTPRSCPATYIGFCDLVRKLFAETLEARARGYGPGRFSFNTVNGRICPFPRRISAHYIPGSPGPAAATRPRGCPPERARRGSARHLADGGGGHGNRNLNEHAGG